MALLGRSEELERLSDLAQSHERIVIVGIPGAGRRTLAAAFVSAHPSWTLNPQVAPDSAPQSVHVSTTLPLSSPDGVLRLAPFEEQRALAFVGSRLSALGADAPHDDALRALLPYADGLPRALDGLVRLIAASGAAGALTRLQRTPLVRLIAHDEGGLRWGEELSKAMQELPANARVALNLLSRLHAPLGDDALGLLEGELGAELILVERGFVAPAGDGRRVLRCVAALEADRDTPELDARFARWVFGQARNARARAAVRGELSALFQQEPRGHADLHTARSAGALLAPLIADRGPIRPHLDRLIELDHALGEGDVETECAIAQLRLVTGQAEAMWRRLEPILDAAGDFQGRAEHLAGSCQRRLGNTDAARAHYKRAVACFEVTDPQHELGMVLSNLGGLEVESGDGSAARKAWSRALRHFVANADPRAEAIVLGDLGLLDHESGDYASAKRRYERALALHEEVGNVRFAGIVSCDLGELALLRGSPKEAAVYLRRALDSLRHTEDARQVTLGEAALSVAEAACGDLEGARTRLDSVRDHAPEDLWPVMDLYAAAIVVHEAGAARRAGNAKVEASCMARAHAALAQATTTPDEARRVAQVLVAELRRYEQRAGWAIAHDAGFFVMPDDTRVDLSRRGLSQRLLRALLDQRLARPGEPLQMDDLLRAGWPGQRVLETAARNRLHVALNTLRKLGVDALLMRHADGYLLDPNTELSVVR